MPSVPATNKTEFQRYLNDRPDAVVSLRRLSIIYAANPHGKNSFGFWLRANHRPRFDLEYRRWWLKRPRLYGLVYSTQ